MTKASSPPVEGPVPSLLLLDSAGILEAPNITPSECVTVPEVTGEISPGGAAHRRLEQLLAAGLRVQASSNGSLARVKRVAQEAGNWGRLSPADASILALALDLPRGKLVTDDYTVLDVARRLGVQTQTIRTKGIAGTKDWTARCQGCGRTYDESFAGRACAVCGAEIRLTPRAR